MAGYDQFFKQAKRNAGITDAPKVRSRFEMPPEKEVRRQKPLNVDQELALELRRRLNEKKATARKKKKPTGIPWKLAGGSFIGLIIAAAGYLEHEKIEQVVKSIEISAFGSAIANEEKAAPVAKPTAKADEKAAEGKDGEAAPAEATKKTFTDQELTHFAKLNERKKELDAREEELNRMETELATQKDALEKRMQALQKTRSEISSVLDVKVKTDEAKVDTLVQMYSTMKPQQAAKIFEEMDEDLAVEIFGKMKKKNAAEVMNIIKPEKAKIFAEKFAGYKRGT